MPIESKWIKLSSGHDDDKSEDEIWCSARREELAKKEESDRNLAERWVFIERERGGGG